MVLVQELEDAVRVGHHYAFGLRSRSSICTVHHRLHSQDGQQPLRILSQMCVARRVWPALLLSLVGREFSRLRVESHEFDEVLESVLVERGEEFEHKLRSVNPVDNELVDLLDAGAAYNGPACRA